MASTILLSDNGASSGSAGLKSTAGNDGVLILQTTTSGGTATNAVYVDTSQNVGIGVTPSAWGTSASSKAQQIGTSLSFLSYGASGQGAHFGGNTYWNGTDWKYLNSTGAVRYEFDNAGPSHKWYYAAAGTAGNTISWTQAMTLDASGNLGIGTTSPSYKFDTSGTGVFGSAGGITLTTATNTVGIRGSSATTVGSAALHLGDNYDTASRQWAVVNGYSAQGALNFLVSSAVNTNPTVSGSVKMTLDPSGNLLVGTTSLSLGGERMLVRTGGVGKNTAFFCFDTTDDRAAVLSFHAGSNGATSRKHFAFLNSGTSEVGSISCTGSATAYNTSSDYRLKDITGSITGEEAKTFIMALQPRKGFWKSDGSPFAGFVAHEFQAVSPTSVVGEKDAVDENGNPVMQAMQASSPEVMANIVALVKEQQAIIEQLQADVAALKGA